MKKIINIIKTRYILSTIVLLGVILIGYFIFRNGNNKQELFTVERGDIIQKVMVTGKTKPVHAVELGFENNGKVSFSYVDLGSRVTEGQALVSLDQSTISADLLRAQANLASGQARLDEMRKGTRVEELAIVQAEVENAKTSLVDAKSNMSTKMTDTYTKSDDAIHNNVDQLFSNPRSSSPQINLILSDNQLKNDLNFSRVQVESILNDMKNNMSDISVSNVIKVNSNLSQIRDFIDKVATAINSYSGNSNISQTTVDSYRASISTARSNINTAISNMTSATEKLNSANSSLIISEKNLSLKQDGYTKEALMAQEAVVLQGQAEVKSVEAQIAKMTLRSPLNGIVTRQDAKVGEIVTPGKSVISIISDNDLEVESNVSEINIGKVAIGNPVDITLDAFPNDIFSGTVSYIEPAETLIDGVVNYKVTISFSEKYSQVKSGLTTNLSIKTSIKTDAVRIPQYATSNKNGKMMVSKKVGSKFEDVVVTTGIVGQDGFVEVLSGLSEGDIIDIVAISSK